MEVKETEIKSELYGTALKNDEPDTKKIKLSNEGDKALIHKNHKDHQEDGQTMSVEYEIPEKGFTYPLEMDASDMLDETDCDGYFPTVTERYLTPYYQLDAQKPGDDFCILIHSNRVCMITLAPSHPILQENKTIESCNYKVSEKLDRTKNKVSGKAKHGAQPLQSNSNLCSLTCTDGSIYAIKCCMIGKLIEVNERLVENPSLLKKEPHFGGYIAIILPNLKHLDSLKEKLLTQQQYEEAIEKRNELAEKSKEIKNEKDTERDIQEKLEKKKI
ncbi:protein Abitram [Nasonia vitripennis]|uniref:Protein Abitram n=1 Tax=Nasonia vitripennis TaxID=7425 RepID=A0A7M7QSK9_NASVI|nr:protein Abitram [Nasonia vitripennis]XP_032454067.1 protein Abitram [Nasonia vitripennis]